MRTYFCNEASGMAGETVFNDVATLAFNPLEVNIKNLFHNNGFFSLGGLFLVFVLLFFTSCWTYGLMIPSGIFVPCLATGAGG